MWAGLGCMVVDFLAGIKEGGNEEVKDGLGNSVRN